MICQNCGTQIIDGAKFCQKCGAPCGIPKEPQEDVQNPKKKRKKQSNALIIISSVLIIVLIASAALYFFVLRNHKEKTPYVTGIKMSDDLFDFTFKLDGSVLSIPCKYEDLSNCGWEISDDDYSKDTVLSPGENVGFDMSKNDSTIKFYSYNPTNKEMPIEDCPVGSVQITDDDDIDFSIAKGISIDSTAKEVEDAFGKVERNYEDDSEFTITYKLDDSENTYTDFHFVDEKNCESITLHNCVVVNDENQSNETNKTISMIPATTISAGDYHIVGLKSDGTVVAVGDNDYGQCDVDSWKDIIAVSAGYFHTVGLKSDGTVVAVGGNDSGQCDVEDWTDIVAVSAGGGHTVGLKSDGTVVSTNEDHDVSDWADIIAVSAGGGRTVGLKSDGTVVATEHIYDEIGNYYGECDVESWTDIVAISAAGRHTVGLKSDGTVVATEYIVNDYSGQCDVDSWTDIVAISAGDRHTVGLKSDGTVVATEYTDYFYHGQCDVDDWTDIVSVSAGLSHTIGLKADGTVVAVGNNNDGQCDVDDWTDIKIPE